MEAREIDVEMTAWDERELLRRCRAGSEAAYAELVRRYRPRLYRIAYRLTNSVEAAEDAVQETFLAAFRAIDRVEPAPSLAAWLTTVVVRQAGRVAGRRNGHRRASLDALLDEYRDAGLPAPVLDGAIDPHSAAESAELARMIAEAIAALPFKYRAAVVLRHTMGLDYAEAAAAMDVPLNTFKSHLLRGTRMLREALGPRLTPPGTSDEPEPHPAEPVGIPFRQPALAAGGVGVRTGAFARVGASPDRRR